MKLSALAIDFDGTIAIDGILDPAVREALADARQHGTAVILVTGRQIDDLGRLVGDLQCFDVVVAENGAVLEARVAEADPRDVAADIAHAIRARYQTTADPT